MEQRFHHTTNRSTSGAFTVGRTLTKQCFVPHGEGVNMLLLNYTWLCTDSLNGFYTGFWFVQSH